VNTRLHRKVVLLPYAKSVEVIDKNTGDGCFFIPELKGGEDVTKAGVDKEEERLHSKRVPWRTPKKKTNTPAPVVDKDYFNTEYKRTVLSYWPAPYNEQDVLEYLNIGDARQKRGCPYVKFVQTLHLLGNEYLSPEKFMQSEGKLYKWEGDFKMQQSNYDGMGELALRLGRIKDPKDDDWRLADGVSLTMYLWSPIAVAVIALKEVLINSLPLDLAASRRAKIRRVLPVPAGPRTSFGFVSSRPFCCSKHTALSKTRA
jgi:hypothetical protein